ncbi:MAG TPA: Gfo/Idh/MocA family oxidoreductase [Chloroflexota bacterium]
MSARLRIAQIGSGHGHAAGKWRALQANADVEAVVLVEPSDAAGMLADPSIVAVAVETRNHQSLAVAKMAVEAGKHVWFDKPAGDDFPAFAAVMRDAAARKLHVQMGYMFRYSPGFMQVTEAARSGELGDVFAVRAHMSTHVNLAERTEQSRHRGGILYDLGGHMLDQIVWLLGRPERVYTVLRNDATAELPGYSDNTLAVLEYAHALVSLEIAAMAAPPTARRFEVHGTLGSAVLEPFDGAQRVVRTQSGTQTAVQLPGVDRQVLYERELAAFVGVVHGTRAPDRAPEHELLVQETLLRATGSLGNHA